MSNFLGFFRGYGFFFVEQNNSIKSNLCGMTISSYSKKQETFEIKLIKL